MESFVYYRSFILKPQAQQSTHLHLHAVIAVCGSVSAAVLQAWSPLIAGCLIELQTMTPVSPSQSHLHLLH